MTPNYLHISDSELLERYQKEDDRAALGYLLSRYTVRLIGVCMKYLQDEDAAKDMVQQVYLKCIYDLKVTDVQQVGGWLYRVTQNACLSALRAKKYNVLSVEDVEEALIDEDNTEDFLIEQHIDALPLALSQLKPEQRTCVELFYLKKQSYQEIAEASNLSIKEVKSYIQNGKRNLKILLTQLKKS